MSRFFIIVACAFAVAQYGTAKRRASVNNDGVATGGNYESIYFDNGGHGGFGSGGGLKSIAQASVEQINTALDKQILVQKLEADVNEAHKQVQAEIQQLKQAQRAAASAQRAAQQAQQQINAINATLNAISGTAAHAQPATKAHAEFGSQQAVHPFKFKHVKFPFEIV